MNYQQTGNMLQAMFDHLVLEKEKLDREEMAQEQDEKSIFELSEELKELTKKLEVNND